MATSFLERMSNSLPRLGVAFALAAALLAGCTGYYLQAAAGHAEVMGARRPFEAVLADPATSDRVRRQLLIVDDALLFARARLGLSSGRSYRHYSDLRRDWVVWNVFAAPELALEPRQWCYPVAGCATYRGWFREDRAREFAGRLAARGDDVFIGGVPAYSTLGWLPDPILSTMLAADGAGLAGLLFHELAHQRVFAPGDTLFNEGFATLVEEEGTRRWLEDRHDLPALCRFQLQRARRAEVLAIIDQLRETLAGVYASAELDPVRRQRKAAALDAARASYGSLRAGWPEPPWFDAWFDAGLNNARIGALASYEDYVPAFRALLAEEGGDLERYYRRVEELARQDPAERAGALATLGQAAGARLSALPASGSCP